jgi:hypothetical protein
MSRRLDRVAAVQGARGDGDLGQLDQRGRHRREPRFSAAEPTATRALTRRLGDRGTRPRPRPLGRVGGDQEGRGLAVEGEADHGAVEAVPAGQRRLYRRLDLGEADPPGGARHADLRPPAGRDAREPEPFRRFHDAPDLDHAGLAEGGRAEHGGRAERRGGAFDEVGEGERVAARRDLGLEDED